MAVIVAIALAVFVLPPAWGIAAVAAGIAIEVGELAFWFRYQRRQKVRTGVEAHVGDRAEVVRAIDPDHGGSVRFRGEVWKARSDERLDPGEVVRVAGTDRLTLIVERRPPAEG